MPEFKDLPQLIGKALERVKLWPRGPKSESPPAIKLRPGSESMYRADKNLLETERPMDVPLWIKEAVVKTIDLAKREKACAFPGNVADLYHGHLLLPEEAKDIPFKQQMTGALGILFHSQELLDSEFYGLDSLKRNLLFDRKTGDVKILDLKEFSKVTPHNAIDPGNVRKGVVSGGAIFFKIDQQGGFVFSSWDNWPPE